MYFFRTKKLAQKLKEGSLKESEKMMCLLSLLIFSVLLLEANYWDMPFNILKNDKRGLFVVIIIMVGVLWSYYFNRKGDGRQFVERFICISWIVTFKWYTFIYLGFLAVAFAFSVFLNIDVDPYKEYHNSTSLNTFLSIEIWVCLHVVFWIRWIADKSGRCNVPLDIFIMKK